MAIGGMTINFIVVIENADKSVIKRVMMVGM
jgi:hypothetical protein